MDREKVLSVNIVLAAGLILISFLLEWLFGWTVFWLIYISTAVLVFTAISKTAGLYIAKGWMAFGMVLGNFNAKILLSLLFFLLLMPLALLRKLTRLKNHKNRNNAGWKAIQDSETVDFRKLW